MTDMSAFWTSFLSRFIHKCNRWWLFKLLCLLFDIHEHHLTDILPCQNKYCHATYLYMSLIKSVIWCAALFGEKPR